MDVPFKGAQLMSIKGTPHMKNFVLYSRTAVGPELEPWEHRRKYGGVAKTQTDTCQEGLVFRHMQQSHVQQKRVFVEAADDLLCHMTQINQ